MLDYSKYKTAKADPEAPHIIESFRSVGYSIETAIADVLDNSISAGANNIWVDFVWKGSDTFLSIKDDGCGMDNDELINAMRPGSKDPNEKRHTADLGRFGLGLKTASFSQCRKFSVVSKKKNHKPVFWTWDMDFVYNHSKKWELIQYLPEGDWQNQLSELSSGTIVIWNDIDRLVKDLRADDKKALNKFLEIMELVKKHLAMVFHRFIENNKIKIFFQTREVIAWNPFLTDNTATQNFPEEPIQNGQVKLRGFVLPHKSKLTDEAFKIAEGVRGWNAQQGFYIYRNERMLLAGEWLGLFRKEEHFKLARIMLDLPNHLDAEWQIDIKKSIARPPLVLKEQLKAYAANIRAQAVEVYRHKGKILQRKYTQQQFQPVWLEKLKQGKRFYEINRDHPLISSLNSTSLTPLLRLLEESLPVPLISIRESEQPDSFIKPFELSDTSEVKKLMTIVYKTLLNNCSPEEAKNKLYFIEPFNEYPEIISSL